ncbi:MAG: hypothetical protein ACFE9I_18460 [Candidatus Hermodarchaeota archaeon]
MLPPQDKALVYIICRQITGRLGTVVLECNGTYIATTEGKKFVYLILDPGLYTFVSKARNIESLQLHIEANKTYFILQKIITQGFMTLTLLQLLNERMGRKKLKKCSLIETESYKESIPTSYQYTEESLTPRPFTSEEKRKSHIMGLKFCIIGVIIIIVAIIFLLSGIFDLMSLWG